MRTFLTRVMVCEIAPGAPAGARRIPQLGPISSSGELQCRPADQLVNMLPAKFYNHFCARALRTGESKRERTQINAVSKHAFDCELYSLAARFTAS
jgi:hypothetical protein